MTFQRFVPLLVVSLLLASEVSAQSATKFTVPGASVSASTHDVNNSAVPANAVDGSLSTRWAGQGDGAFITFDLGATQVVQLIKVAWYQGTTRTTTFDVLASTSASGPWTTLVNRAVSSGTPLNLETHDFADTQARYIRVVGHGNSSGNPGNLNPANGVLLGETWSYEIKVVGQSMTVKVTPQGRATVTATFTLESGYNDAGMYFKAGVYNQNNTGESSDSVQATFYSVTHTHP